MRPMRSGGEGVSAVAKRTGSSCRQGCRQYSELARVVPEPGDEAGRKGEGAFHLRASEAGALRKEPDLIESPCRITLMKKSLVIVASALLLAGCCTTHLASRQWEY